MKNLIRNIILGILAACFILSMGCKSADTPGFPSDDVTKLSFQAGSGYDYLKTLDGKKVSISGYMATSSPVDGSFMFLMNLPYQSCPFCVPNTSQLSNTMEIYPKKNKPFEYTSQAIKVVGTLDVADSEDKPFTDMYGYEFNYKIVDATYTIIPASELSDNMILWQKVAESDFVSDIYAMYDYVHFLCAWNTYFVNPSTDAAGNSIPGYFLYAVDALNFVTLVGGQYNYGYQPDFFSSIISKIESVDPDAFSDIVANVSAAEKLAKKALAELETGNYSFEEKYVEQFGVTDYVYTIDIGDELLGEFERLYEEFSNWLGSWEL